MNESNQGYIFRTNSNRHVLPSVVTLSTGLGSVCVSGEVTEQVEPSRAKPHPQPLIRKHHIIVLVPPGVNRLVLNLGSVCTSI